MGMIKLKDILKEIEGEKIVQASWMTPPGTPDAIVDVTHQIIQQIMQKTGSGNDLLLAHFLKTQQLDEGTWGVWNPSTGMLLRYTKRGGIWEMNMAGDAVGRQINETDLDNIITHWMR
jgi:hypothetical protein